MSYTPIVQFITTEYLRSVVPIEQNVDDARLVPYIIQGQDLYVQGVIGESGYNALKDGITGNTLTSDEVYLMLNFIQPMVANYAFYLAIPHIAYKPTNKSISKESSEYSQPLDLEEMKYLRNGVKDVAEFYTRRMVKYLNDYSNLFPWYSSPQSKDNLPRSSQSYFSGIYTPRGNTRGFRSWQEPYGNTDPCNPCGGWEY